MIKRKQMENQLWGRLLVQSVNQLSDRLRSKLRNELESQPWNELWNQLRVGVYKGINDET